MLISRLEFQLDNSILTQRVLRLRIGPADVSTAWNRIAAKLCKLETVPGFRQGKAPLHVVRNVLKTRIAAEAFQELKRAALDQVMQQLDAADKPLLPPELLDPGQIQHRYGLQLEFAVKYLIDPSGLTRNPAQPEFQQGAVMHGETVQQLLQAQSAPGIPQEPAAPKAQ